MGDEFSKICPGCGDLLNIDARVCACGWSIGKGSPRSKAPRHPDHWKCAWQAHGERCQRAGSISASTKGEGPWFCRFHAFQPSREEGERAMEASHSGHLYKPEATPMPQHVRDAIEALNRNATNVQDEPGSLG